MIQTSLETLRVTLNPTYKQHLAWTYLWDSVTTDIGFGGGAGGGKSRLGCEWIISCCLRYPGTRWFIGRKELKTLKKTTLLTFFEVASIWGLKQSIKGSQGDYKYNEVDSIITFANGSVIHLLELDYFPSDPEYERFGSTEYTGGFIDEAGQVRFKAKEVLKSRMRFKLDDFGLIPKLLSTFNPSKGWLYLEYYKPWKKGTLPQDTAFVQALARDNPHLSAAYIKTLRNLRDKASRERLWKGNWEYEDDPNALYPMDVITDLFTNPVAPDPDNKCIIADIARLGRDKTVIFVWYGLVVVQIYIYEKLRTTEVVEKLEKIAEAHKIPRSRILVDEDGVGGGVVDQLRCKGFVGNSSPIQPKVENIPFEMRNPDNTFKVNYLNLRSQCYYVLSDYAADRKIKVTCKLNETQQYLTEELEQIKGVDVDKDGKLKIIAKDEIKEVLGRSPDFADTLMMRMYFELGKIPEPAVRSL